MIDSAHVGADRRHGWTSHFDRIVVFAGTAWVGFTLFALSLANLGMFSRASVAAAIAASLLVAAGVARSVPRNRVIRGRSTAIAVAIAALAAIFVLWGVGHSGEHVITDRDPGVYATAGIWLAEHGNLEVGFGEGLLDLPSGFTSTSPGYVPAGEGNLQPDFMHGLVVWLAASKLLLGERSIYWFNVFVMASAGLMLTLTAARLGLRGGHVIVVLALALLNPLTLFLATDVYSEPSALLAVAIVAYSLVAIRSSNPVVWQMMLVSGLAVGSITLFRLDGPAYLVGWAAALLLLVIGSPNRRATAVSSAAAWIASVTLVLIGWLFAVRSASGYVAAHRGVAAPLLVVGIASVLLGAATSVVVGRSDRLGRIARRILGHPILPAAAVVVILLGAFWFGVGRPILTRETGTPPGFVADIVRAELGGATPFAVNEPLVDVSRTYYEQSGLWQIRYWGVAAIVAAIVAITGAVAGGEGSRTKWNVAALSLLLLPPMALFLQSPSVTPDHLWAMRRYVPTVIPVVALFAALSISGVARAAAGVYPAAGVRSVVVALAVVAVAWVPVIRSLPLIDASQYVGFVGSIRSLCDAMPAGGAVVMVGDEFRAKLQAPVRAMCNVPVVAAGDGTTQDDIRGAVASLVEAGYEPVLLASQELDRETVPLASDRFVYRVTEWTVTEPPRRQVTVPCSWVMYPGTAHLGS